jgi:hypothetical protein
MSDIDLVELQRDSPPFALHRHKCFSINPNLVVVDRNRASLVQLLEKQGLDVTLAALQNVGARERTTFTFQVKTATVSDNLSI